MNDNVDKLTIIISQLIISGKENDYYDFKQEWYRDNISLIHDIICMANVITHEGDRYIIIGVDNQFKIIGVDNDKNKKRQQDIICILKDHDFNGDYRPDIELAPIILEGKTVDVLIIKDKPFKPYLLKKLRVKDNKNIYPSIYTRVGDTNTPIDSSADYNLIEKMFEERFGLSKNPLSRMILYLLDFKNWKSIDFSENTMNFTQYYYTKFPEFTVNYFNDSSESDWPETDCYGNLFTSYVVEYLFHSTVLDRWSAIVSKDGRLCFPKPKYCESFHFSTPEYRESFDSDKNVPYFVYYNYQNTIVSNTKYLFENIYGVSSGLHQKQHYQFIEFKDKDEKDRFFEPENQKKVMGNLQNKSHRLF